MFSLLVLSLALSASASAAQALVSPTNPPAASSQPFAQALPNGPLIIEQGPARPFDDMEIHPDPDTCYRIRFFQFSKGKNPKFLREMTCGPNAPKAEKTDESKPGFMPLELKTKPPAQGEQDVPVQ